MKDTIYIEGKGFVKEIKGSLSENHTLIFTNKVEKAGKFTKEEFETIRDFKGSEYIKWNFVKEVNNESTKKNMNVN